MHSGLQNRYRNRWCLIPFLSSDSLHDIHEAEDRMGDKWWQVFQGLFFNQILLKNELKPYWIGDMPAGVAGDRLNEYITKTYPIWAPIIMEWESTWDNDVCESERSVLHRIEEKLWSSNVDIDRLAPSSMSKALEKRAIKDKLSRALES